MKETRRQAREWAVQMLTAADLNPAADPQSVVDAFWAQHESLDAEDGGDGGEKVPAWLRKFADERVLGVLGELAEIDAALAPLMENWDISRLGTVERAVLRLGAWELRNTDVPRGVVINEAIDLVNWFSSPRSRSLVNGVLDKYAKSLKR